MQKFYSSNFSLLQSAHVAFGELFHIAICFSNYQYNCAVTLLSFSIEHMHCGSLNIISPYLCFVFPSTSCYLALGEVEDAARYFRKCLHSGSDVCVDRKIAVEASDGIQKAQVL